MYRLPLVVLVLFLTLCQSRRLGRGLSQDIACIGCKATLKEIDNYLDKNYAYLNQNSDTKVQVSFRMDKKHKKVAANESPRVEAAVHEALDEVCKEFGMNWGIVTNDEGIRFAKKMDGEIGGKLEINSKISGQLKSSCHLLVGEFDDEILEAYKNKEERKVGKICVEASHCKFKVI
jgi:hypothetical protein